MISMHTFSINLYPKKLVTLSLYKHNWSLLGLHSKSHHVFIHKHFIKSFRKTALKNHSMYKWITYMTVTYYAGTQIIRLGGNWKPCLYNVLILIKIRFYFLPMFLNFLICYYEEKKLKLLIVVCRFESTFYIYHPSIATPLISFFTNPLLSKTFFRQYHPKWNRDTIPI